MNLASIFQQMQRIFGFCPCCDAPFRLSDVLVFAGTLPPTTPFDIVEAKLERLERAKERFEQQRNGVRDAATHEGRQQAARRLREILPSFVCGTIDPSEVKLIFDPVRYVVFHGLASWNPTRVEFVDTPPETKEHETLISSLDRALRGGNIEWRTLRVAPDGAIHEE